MWTPRHPSCDAKRKNETFSLSLTILARVSKLCLKNSSITEFPHGIMSSKSNVAEDFLKEIESDAMEDDSEKSSASTAVKGGSLAEFKIPKIR